MLMAHAAKATYVTVERITDDDFLADPALAAGTIPAMYVSALAVAPHGASPIGLPDTYADDAAALARYARAARTDAGFKNWLDTALAEPVPA